MPTTSRIPYRGTNGLLVREDDESHHLDPQPSALRTMLAKYRGTCVKTGARIAPGDTITYARGVGSTLVAKAESGRYISDVIRTSGGTFYRNKAGRCLDAPCCGCCDI